MAGGGLCSTLVLASAAPQPKVNSPLVSPTKFGIPRQGADLVARERLASAVREAIGTARLLLLCAPAGFGKTALLAQVVSEPGAADALAWINVDESDDLQRLLAALIEVLDPFDVPWRMAPEALLRRAEDPANTEALAREFAEQLGATAVTRGVIVLDDMHRTTDPQVFQFLSTLLRLWPPQWTLAMTTREQPPIPLARMALEGTMREWREADLRFTVDEVAEVLAARGAPVDLERAQRTLAHTQGWPVGVVIGRFMEGEGASPGELRRVKRHLFDFFDQEVMGRLPPELQRFLLRCSVLDVMTDARCLQVSADPLAPRWLREIARRELFVVELEAPTLALRLHDLFREYLVAELQDRHPGQVPEVLRLAAASEPDLVAAVGQLLRAGDLDAAAARLFAGAQPMVQAGAGEQLLRLLMQFPEAYRNTSADLAFVRGLCAWHRYGFKTVILSMKQAAEGFDRQQRWLDSLKARSFAALTLINTARYEEGMALWNEAHAAPDEPEAQLMIAFRDVSRSVQHGPWQETAGHIERALALMSSSCDATQWEYFFPWMSAFVGRPGAHGAMLNLVNLLGSVNAERYPLMRATATMLRAWMRIWQGDLAGGRELVVEAEADSRWFGQLATVALPCVQLRAVDAQLSGDHAKAQKLMDLMVQAASRAPDRRPELIHVGFKGAYAAAHGDWEGARAALQLMQERVHLYDLRYVHVDTAVLGAQLALHEGRVEDALATLREQGPGAADNDRWGLFDRTSVTWARAELAAGSPERAWEALRPALQWAKDTGNVAGLLLCGQAALAELEDLPSRTSVQADLAEVLGRLVRQARIATSTPRAAPPPRGPAEADLALTDREVEVLSLIAGGMSNKLIARQLNLSPHTIKRHVARILEKTGQPGRGRAAQWYRASGTRTT